MKAAPFVVECSDKRNGPWRDAMPRGVCWQRAKDANKPARNFWLSSEGAGLFVRVVAKALKADGAEPFIKL